MHGQLLLLEYTVEGAVSQGHIGLNEVAIGISVPLYWGRLMARIIGEKPAEHLCKFAVLLPPQDAHKVTNFHHSPH